MISVSGRLLGLLPMTETVYAGGCLHRDSSVSFPVCFASSRTGFSSIANSGGMALSCTASAAASISAA